MLFIFNATGKIKFRIIPRFKFENDKKGVWYFEFSWLRWQSTIYSKKMGCKIIQILNRSVNEQGATDEK